MVAQDFIANRIKLTTEAVSLFAYAILKIGVVIAADLSFEQAAKPTGTKCL